MYVRFQTRSFNGLDVRRFLRYLLTHLHGPVVLLWDRGPIHRRREVQEWIRQHPRLRIEPFPAYAPERNPAEDVWCQSDNRLANSAPANVPALARLLHSSIHKTRSSQKLLWSCIDASDLPWTKWLFPLLMQISIVLI